MTKELLAARLKVEHAYYMLMGDVGRFASIWGIGNVFCSIQEDGVLLIN